MNRSTKIKAVLYTVLVGEAGGTDALRFAWDRFADEVLGALPVAELSELGALKIVVVIALGIYLFLRDPKGERRLSGEDIALIRRVVSEAGARRDPAAPGPRPASPATEETET